MIPTHSVIQYKKYDHAYSGKVPSDTDISAYCRYYINEEYPLVLNVVYCRRVVTTGGGGVVQTSLVLLPTGQGYSYVIVT